VSMCTWRFCAYFMVRPQLLTCVSALARGELTSAYPCTIQPESVVAQFETRRASIAHENSCHVVKRRTKV
jgi:hypothetical protein